MNDQPQTTARELYQVVIEHGYAAFEAACRKTLANEWRLGFDAGTRVASRAAVAFIEEEAKRHIRTRTHAHERPASGSEAAETDGLHADTAASHDIKR